MKKIIVFITSTCFVVGCSDQYSEYRNLTVQDYLNDQDLLIKVSDFCNDGKIKDVDICETVKKAIYENHSF